MITKRHIRKYLDRLSSDKPSGKPQLSDELWHELYEYLVKHYKRLDKGARAYADEIFDQLDASLRRRIESLPEGQEKKTLGSKLAIVRSERSPIPVLYLDTPVVENFIRRGLGQPPSQPAGGDVGTLCEAVLGLVKRGQLICPENTFHREVLQMGGPEAQHGLNIMREFSEGLSFKHNQAIEDSQVYRALRAFIAGNGTVEFRSFWKDALEKKTVSTIMRKRSSVLFQGVRDPASGIPGIEHQQGNPASFSMRLRIRYDEAALGDEQALQKRCARHLRDLVRLGLRYQAMIKKKAQKRHLDGFWAAQKTDLPVALWNYCKGEPEGLEGLTAFYESEHFRDIPAMKNKQDIWNAFSHNHPQGLPRLTGPPDIAILSSILPYTDMMILGPNIAGVVRDTLKLNTKFDTEIYGMNEQDRIMAALKELVVE